MRWLLSTRDDPLVRPLADRHYNRQTVGADGFVPPGRCLVLRTDPVDAFWVTAYPFAEYVLHRWGGAFVCSAFRNENRANLSSELIREAVAATLWRWPAPDLGMITFVDTRHVRRKRDPGRCYRKAGFQHVGYTQGGLVALQLLPDDMPAPEPPLNGTMRLIFEEAEK